MPCKRMIWNAPIGTIAPSIIGGHWERTAYGWQANDGSTFPTPGGDWNGKLIPPQKSQHRDKVELLARGFRQGKLGCSDPSICDRCGKKISGPRVWWRLIRGEEPEASCYCRRCAVGRVW